MNRSSQVKILVLAVVALGASLFVFMHGTVATSAAADHASSPRTLYMQNCARCHGADGKANTTLGRKYKADDISDGVGTSKIIRIVTNGKGHMPSFRRKLTSAQIAQIANYVHAF